MNVAFLPPKHRPGSLIMIAALLFLFASSLPASPGVFTYKKDSFSYNGGVVYGNLKRVAGHPFSGSDTKPFKSSYYFDGASYIDVADMKSFSRSGADPFSLSVWIKPARQYDLSVGSPIVSKWNRDGRGEFFLSINSDGRLNFGRNYPGGAIISAGSVNFSRWNHAAVSYDGKTIKIYINGKLKGSMSSRARVSAVPNIPVLVGAWYKNGKAFDHYKGSIEDIRVYDYALSADEISNLSVDNEIYGKKASHSDEIAGNNFAALAVDGDMNTFSRTPDQLYPWWKVDLGSDYHIARVVVHRGPDCDWPRGFAGRYFSLELDGARVFEAATPPVAKGPILIDLGGKTGRELKIQSYGRDACLQIREVKISAKPAALIYTNVALNKIVSQSATYKNSVDYSGGKAVDGDLASFAKTDNLSPPYWNSWKVRLGQSHRVDKIKIYNSPNCPDCWKDLNRFSVHIDDKLVCPLEVNGQSACLPEKGVCDTRCDDIRVTEGGPVTIKFKDKNIRGKKIEIRRTPTDRSLSLGEVEVYGAVDLDDAPFKLWGADLDGEVYRLRGDWEVVPTPGFSLKRVFAVYGGYAWGIVDRNGIYRWNPSTSKWRNLSSLTIGYHAADSPITYVSEDALGKGSKGRMWTISGGKRRGLGSVLFMWTGIRPVWESWKYVGASGTAKQLVATFKFANTNIILTEEGKIFKGNIARNTWRQIPGHLKQISASGSSDPWKSKDVWGVGAAGQTFRWDGKRFANIGETDVVLKQISVGVREVWGIDKEGRLFAWNEGIGKTAPKYWERVGWKKRFSWISALRWQSKKR